MMPARRMQEEGFAAIAALVVLVLLAALGSFLLTISNTAHLTSAQDIQGSRAHWAARGGLEWAVASVAASAPVAPAVAPPATCPTSAAPATLDGFALVVTCLDQSYSEGAVTVHIFSLTSVVSTAGVTVGNLGFIERSVSASMER